MKLTSILYLPPPGIGFPEAIQRNLEQFKSKYGVLLFSDYPWPGAMTIRSPEPVRAANPSNKFAISNAVMLTGLRILDAQEFTHVIVLEPDVRVGADNWDEKIWDGFFNSGRPTVAAGTLACYNPCNYSRAAAKRWETLVSQNVRRNVPIATYGWLPSSQKAPTCLFPNGALAAYEVRTLKRLLPLDNTLAEAAQMGPWDMEIGVRLWKDLEEDTYDAMEHLPAVYSSVGDVLTTEDERLTMLANGEAVAVHQVKSARIGI